MSQAAKAQEPSMEEILASIRRIIADDDASKVTKAPEPAAPKTPPVAAVPGRPAPPRAPAMPPAPPPPAVANSQDEIDAMLATVDSPANVAPAPLKSAATPPPTPGPAAAFRTIDAASDVVFTDRPPDPPAELATRTVDEARRQFTQSAAPDRALISNATMAAVDSAFNSLAGTVLGNNARTLEDMVKEMLRPMLKSWLDDNLPGLVDRIVRAEIERVSRGRS